MSDQEFLKQVKSQTESTPSKVIAGNEGFWARWSVCYDRDPSFLQMNYGFYHPSLSPVFEVECQTSRDVHRRGSHFKAAETEALLEAARTNLARLVGATPEEVAVTRNASEALNIVIHGLSLQPGDEVVCSDHDYTAVAQALATRENYDHIVVRPVALAHDTEDTEIEARFAAQISPRTRLLVVTHLVHVTGQVLPLARLCALGRSQGVPVLVDAAHSFAQIPFRFDELECDYLAASLHKWLGAPLGSGLLVVRRERIADLRPLFGESLSKPGDIRRFERFGNRPDAINAGISEAVKWHEALGTPVKQARLAHLQTLWTEPIRRVDGYRVFTPRAEGRFGAIGLVSHEDLSPEVLCRYLMEVHQIFTSVQSTPLVSGVRIVPGLPSSAQDVRKVAEALMAAPEDLKKRPWR